jgi:glycosyltransferase involved in cell wall biosynthesis
MEIIVVDDGSTDRSFHFITDTFYRWLYNKKSEGFTYMVHRHDKNKGCYGARNTALKHCTGDIITFQDADDISLDYRIEDQVNALLGEKVEMTTSLILRTHLHVLPTDKVKLHEDILKSRIHIDSNKFCCRAKVGLVTTMFRRKVMDKLGKYLEWSWGADAEYVRRLFPHVKENQSMMSYLNENRHIPGKHHCVSEILYLSHEMTEDNLTYKRKKGLASH